MFKNRLDRTGIIRYLKLIGMLTLPELEAEV